MCSGEVCAQLFLNPILPLSQSSDQRQITEESSPFAPLKSKFDWNSLIGMLKEIPVHPSVVPLLINDMTV